MLPGLHRADTMKRHDDERRETRSSSGVSEQKRDVWWRVGMSKDAERIPTPLDVQLWPIGRGYDAIDAARGVESFRGVS